MAEQKYHPGDKVTALQYDVSERPPNHIGVCEVVSAEKTWGCESGWLVTLKSARKGAPITLDQNWLEYAYEQRELSI